MHIAHLGLESSGRASVAAASGLSDPPGPAPDLHGGIRMSKLADWAKRGLIAISPLFVAMAASAAGPSDVSPALRESMQRDLGLSSAQVSQYLRIEHLANVQEK